MNIQGIKTVLSDELIRECIKQNSEISHLAYDSRKAERDGAFVCLKGALSDGHKYILNCAEKGVSLIVMQDEKIYEQWLKDDREFSILLVKDTRKALALISAAFFGYPAKNLFVIGLTGTKGKTSTTFMTKAILERSGKKVGIIGTTGIYYANKYEYIDNSTPESYEIHRLFSCMIEEGVDTVLIEVSSQALMMHRTYGISFDIGVFTNLSPDHIGENEHSSFEEYKECKGILFTQSKKAIINDDSNYIDYYKSIIDNSGIECITYSAKNKNADFYAYNIRFEMTPELSTRFNIKGYGEMFTNVPGEFSVYNCLVSTAIALCCGAPFTDAVKALSDVHVFGRVEPVKHPKCSFSVLIDYAHNALSLESLYKSIMIYSPKNIYCVFGCGGNRSKLRRYDMGEISGKYATLSVLTSDNPRTETVEAIIDDILVGMNKSGGKYTVIKDRREAIRYALSISNPGDIVLIVGKGNQLYEEIGHEKIYFNEREVVKEYFDER